MGLFSSLECEEFLEGIEESPSTRHLLWNEFTALFDCFSGNVVKMDMAAVTLKLPACIQQIWRKRGYGDDRPEALL